MPSKLDKRLSAVALQIRSRVHADIGSDHGYLLKALLMSGRIDRGIAIENKQRPYQNSLATLAALNAEVRFADGLAGLEPGEADSLSLCGMGGELIVNLLHAYPDRIPPDIVIQPNRRPELVRRWALHHHFHLIDEQFIILRQRYVVMRFQHNATTPDPAYFDTDQHAAELFGPLLIKRWEPAFSAALRDEHQYLAGLAARSDSTALRLALLGQLLDCNHQPDVS